jgi:2-amino-4-hydroxy-6-hydroxymethyldihydropteridine diphosphokinase
VEDSSGGAIAAIGLGSNLGDRAAHLQRAVLGLQRLPGTRLLAVSRFIETEPLARPDGGDPGGPYLNAAATVQTALSPRALLEGLLAIEREAGRVRGSASGGMASGGERWAARTLDLDLLLYGDQVIDEEGLSVPHPRLPERAFVLIPLAEIAPELPVPGPHGGRTVAQLLANLQQGCSA